MFVDAIETAAKFTRPIHMIYRNYASTAVYPGAATLFFVNSDGWALTCGHVAKSFQAGKQLQVKYKEFKDELASYCGDRRERQLRKKLELKYNYTKQTEVELHCRFMNCIKNAQSVKTIIHNSFDIALLKFEGSQILCDTFPVFAKNTSDLKQGKFLCRLGFPFPEFTNYSYDKENDKIVWTEIGRKDTPQFPIEGMVTRHLIDRSGNIFGFEMSTPGLRGQSGGPAFDQNAKVWGMQMATNHLDLNFDVDQEVVRRGLPKSVQDSAFLHVGHCIHAEVLKLFMRENNVHFDEG
jgi:hypothetical protein